MLAKPAPSAIMRIMIVGSPGARRDDPSFSMGRASVVATTTNSANNIQNHTRAIPNMVNLPVDALAVDSAVY